MKLNKISLSILMTVFVLLVVFSCESPYLKGAKVYIQQEQWDKAKVQLIKAVEENPNDADAWFWLGRCYALESDFENMNDAFDRSLAAKSRFKNDIDAARQKYYAQHFNNGINYYNTGIEKYRDPNAKDEATRILDKAIEEFQTASRVMPDDIKVKTNLATLYYQTRKLDEAERIFLEIIGQDPNNVTSLMLLGKTYYDKAIQNNDDKAFLEKAVEYLSRAKTLDPTDAAIITDIAYSYDKLGKKDEAIKAYDEAVEKFPEDFNLLFNYGIFLDSIGDSEKTLVMFKKVAELNPDDKDAIYNVSITLMKMEKYADAVPYWEKLIKLDEKHGIGWYNLGVCYARINEVEKANAAFEKAKELGVE